MLYKKLVRPRFELMPQRSRLLEEFIGQATGDINLNYRKNIPIPEKQTVLLFYFQSTDTLKEVFVNQGSRIAVRCNNNRTRVLFKHMSGVDL